MKLIDSVHATLTEMGFHNVHQFEPDAVSATVMDTGDGTFTVAADDDGRYLVGTYALAVEGELSLQWVNHWNATKGFLQLHSDSDGDPVIRVYHTLRTNPDTKATIKDLVFTLLAGTRALHEELGLTGDRTVH